MSSIQISQEKASRQDVTTFSYHFCVLFDSNANSIIVELSGNIPHFETTFFFFETWINFFMFLLGYLVSTVRNFSDSYGGQSTAVGD